jgi:hypothetical protein
MIDFDEKVEELCRKMCDVLHIEAEPTKSKRDGWKRFRKMTSDWLEMEAFNRVRRDHFDTFEMMIKQQPQLLLENQS